MVLLVCMLTHSFTDCYSHDLTVHYCILINEQQRLKGSITADFPVIFFLPLQD